MVKSACNVLLGNIISSFLGNAVLPLTMHFWLYLISTIPPKGKFLTIPVIIWVYLQTYLVLLYVPVLYIACI